MTSSFGWNPKRAEGVWRYGPPCMRPLVALAPWLTVALLLLLFHLVGATLVAGKGVLFDLPDSALAADGETTGPVALILPVAHDTLVFFDDSRYLLGNAASTDALLQHLSEAAAQPNKRTMLVLADRRVPTGDVMRFADLARAGGVKRVLFAEKKQREAEE